MDHEFLDDPMEFRGVVVAVPGMGDEVFDGFGSGFREEADVDVAVGRVDDGGTS